MSARPSRRNRITLKRILAGFVAMIVGGLLASLAGCGGGGATADNRPLVVTTVPIVYSLTANVAGDAVRLENILPAGASPHQVSFTPDQAKLVGDAKLLIENGAGLELWVDDLIKNSGNSGLTVAVASKGVTYLEASKPIPVAGSSAGGEVTNVDPHVWLDAKNAIVMVRNIQAALATLDPPHAADYQQRADAYIATLTTLDTQIAAQTKDLPHKDFVSFHSAFQYYARAYGLRQVAVIEQFPGKEPSPQYLAGIVDLVKQSGVTAVFSEPQFSPRPAEALAKEVGVQVYAVDPEGSSLTPGGYEKLMRDNTGTFVKALGGTP